MPPKVNRETSNKRLLILARYLEKLPKKRFYFATWVGDDWKGSPDLSCGTTACALGHAATMPEFQKLGLEIENIGFPARSIARIHNRNTGMAELAAAQEIFGITFSQAEMLFLPHSEFSAWPRNGKLSGEATAKEVAAHIRKFVAR